MKVTFLGATHEVTGSCTLIEVNGKRILIDCGMEQGADVFENQEIPVAPSMIDCIVLTHAHIDHSGKMPMLYRNGFSGLLYATRATCDLCNIMLRDSAHIQESEAEWRNRKAKRSGGKFYEPLYETRDVEELIEHLRPCDFDRPVQAAEGVELCFRSVGHLLGAASVEVVLTENGVTKKIVFSGDIGNVYQPIISDDKNVTDADYVVMESTYGDRTHERPGDYISELAGMLQSTFGKGGNVVIPSFAVGRTQEILYFIREIKEKELVKGHDGFPVYMDSPLANEATAVFLQCDEAFLDDATREIIDRGQNPIMFPGLVTAVSANESKAINFDKRPKVIISASGMCEAGRIRHHLKHNLWRPECLILFVGYQSAGTLGRILVDGAKKVKLFNEEITVKARIDVLKGISGHADRSGLSDWICSFKKKPELVFVNHGDDSSCVSFTEHLVNDLGFNAVAPYSGTCYDLVTGQPVEETQGILVDKKKKTAQKNSAYNRLLGAGERLLDIIKASEGLSNKELARFADQITSLCDRLKNQ